MFSGCRTQGTLPWRKCLRSGERDPIFIHLVFVFRTFWNGHLNDRERNRRIACRVQCRRTLKSLATSEGLSAPSTCTPNANSDGTTRLLPAPEGPYCPTPKKSNFARDCFDNQALKELEKDIHVDSIINYVASPNVRALKQDVQVNEEEHEGAGGTSTRKREIQWGKHQEKKRFINRLLQDKSALSYDWRVPLKLLKRYYKSDGAVSHDQANLIRESPASSMLHPNVIANTIPEPKTWTKGTFDSYVYDLARFQPPSSPVSRALGLRQRRGGPHTIPEIGETLHGLIHRKDLRNFLEPEICNVAIGFFARHYMLFKARSLFFLMEHLAMPIPTSTMNILMQAAAHQKDLHSFTWLLNIMIKRGLNPDAKTWALFLQCIETMAVKRLIIREMAALGILHKSHIRRQVTSSTAKEDIIEFLAGKQEPKDFLHQMRLKHGPDWMSPRTGNSILNEVCKRVSLTAGLDLLEPLKKHGFSPDEVTLNTPLFQSLEMGSIHLAAGVLEVFEKTQNLMPGRLAHEKLFTYAWKRGYLNVIRVIWISACLNGFVTYRMQAKVLYSLRLSAIDYQSSDYSTRRPTRQPNRSWKVFRSLMGKFLIGIPPLQHHSWGYSWRAVMESLRVANKARLKCSLGTNLREAHNLDREWRIHEGKDVAKKLQLRYPVLLVTDRIDTLRGY